MISLESVSYQTMRCVIWRHADLDPVSHHHLYPVLFHASRKDTPDCDIIVTLNFHGATTQNPGDYTLQLN